MKSNSEKTTKTSKKKMEQNTSVLKEAPILEKTQPSNVVNTIKNESNLHEEDYSLKSAELDFNTEVYDEGDIASAIEMGFLAKALEAHKAKVAPEKHPDFDGVTCLDCGDDIPQVRLAMGRMRCVYCQEILEKKNKMRG
jgi:RNA polymerase-binding transcription factor DksA